MILSAEKLITSQDLHISGFIKDLFRPCVIVLNKIDLIEKEILQNIKNEIKDKFKHIPDVPIIFTSALNKKNIDEIIPIAIDVYNNSIKKISQKELNQCFLDAISKKQPDSKGNKRPEIHSIKQYKIGPPGFKFESTNRCGEVPLLPNESCNLGSINVAKFTNNENNDIDWDRLRECTRNAIHFLDNVVTKNQYPTKEIEELSRNMRRLGLGVMGLADLLS